MDKLEEKNFRIVLVEPQIPQNTGNIARLCSCTDCELYLVGKMGFVITDKHVKRAGLDYWDDLNVQYRSSLDELRKEFPENNFYYISTKATKCYTNASYKQGDFIVFGSETAGLPAELIKTNTENSLKIPMKTGKRSLNLSNSVAIVIYEAVRQTQLLKV